MWRRENFELTENNRSILKRIRFKFRVDYDAEAGGRVLLKRNDVETVCLLSRRKPDSYVHLNLKMEDYYRIKDAQKEQEKK